MTLYHTAIADILLQLNEKSPQKAIIREGNSAVTVQEIYKDAVQIALQLQLQGFKVGDCVAIAAPPNATFVKIMYGLIFLKATVAIIDPEMGRDNYQAKLKQLNPKWAFVDARLLLLQEHPILRYLHFKKSKTAPYFPPTPTAQIIACGGWMPLFQKKIFLNNWFKKPIHLVFEWQKESLSNGTASTPHDFLITYTSGTLAEPKGVVHSFHSLVNSLKLIGNQLDTNKENLIAPYLPHYMLIGFSVNMPSILYNPILTAVEKLLFFKKHQVTTIMGPPSDFVPMIAYCEQTKTLFPTSIQHLLLGSAPVTRRFLERLCAVLPAHTRITCLYGMTENLLVATIDGRFKKDYDCEGDLLGKPATGVIVKIVADEIVLHSNQLFTRYFHLKERPEFHETGDLGVFDKKGFLVLQGRKKDMIIRRNFNIYPSIYEATINRIEGVTEAVLIGVYNDIIHDEKVYLIIEGAPYLDRQTIFNQLKRGVYAIDAEALPDEILFKTLPRSGRQHKVNKTALRNEIKSENQIKN